MENTYLVYELGTPEMESEGWSSRYNFLVVEANSEDEAILKWGEIKDKTVERKGDKWVAYYEVVASKIPINQYGCAKKLTILD